MSAPRKPSDAKASQSRSTIDSPRHLQRSSRIQHSSESDPDTSPRHRIKESVRSEETTIASSSSMQVRSQESSSERVRIQSRSSREDSSVQSRTSTSVKVSETRSQFQRVTGTDKHSEELRVSFSLPDEVSMDADNSRDSSAAVSSEPRAVRQARVTSMDIAEDDDESKESFQASVASLGQTGKLRKKLSSFSSSFGSAVSSSSSQDHQSTEGVNKSSSAGGGSSEPQMKRSSPWGFSSRESRLSQGSEHSFDERERTSPSPSPGRSPNQNQASFGLYQRRRTRRRILRLQSLEEVAMGKVFHGSEETEAEQFMDVSEGGTIPEDTQEDAFVEVSYSYLYLCLFVVFERDFEFAFLSLILHMELSSFYSFWGFFCYPFGYSRDTRSYNYCSFGVPMLFVGAFIFCASLFVFVGIVFCLQSCVSS
ncbi:uncharacterized protein LOC101847030 [Aplysia californica]|uniref:Uncharacterized protein LOC101847030 n=1 Tax=Aplysia californica TaxID=6500 RepID=A0ABM0ZXH7_APLCA|nr:uncharacterized protein LOC101847030 [Aplysia californica]XP_012936533.1 uncharacterized protein LOC101847030 [Aplysia californica]